MPKCFRFFMFAKENLTTNKNWWQCGLYALNLMQIWQMCNANLRKTSEQNPG